MVCTDDKRELSLFSQKQNVRCSWWIVPLKQNQLPLKERIIHLPFEDGSCACFFLRGFHAASFCGSWCSASTGEEWAGFPKGSVRLTWTARVENPTNVATLVPNCTESTGLSGMEKKQSSEFALRIHTDFLGEQTRVQSKQTKQAWCECTLNE